MINFTVGPVQSEDYILDLGRKQVPYFRTPEFSAVMEKSENDMIRLAKAPADARVCFLTGSGTASMEAVVMNCFTPEDNILIVNGGSFGSRFVQMCGLHGLRFTEIKCEAGRTLTSEQLEHYDGKGYTAFLVNIHETSTGVYYDPVLISDFCRRNRLFLAVDAISSFLADEFRMEAWGVNAMITGSQKALAVPPGVSIVVLDQTAIERVEKNQAKCMYLDLKRALKDGERGQTPFTPAVGILLQISERLDRLVKNGGAESETERIHKIAEDFRKGLREINLPLAFFSDNMSNAVTTLKVREEKDAYRAFEILKEEYGIWICPNGGDLMHQVFRVGHIGALTTEDNQVLLKALKEIQERGII